MSVDYSYCKALQHGRVPMGSRCLLCYDVNCQYCVNLRRRVEESKALSPMRGYINNMAFGIGQWHVHGHRSECFSRFSPLLMPGAGKRSGEILESLWDGINPVFGRTRTMTNAHRVEIIDAAMADNNWKKLTTLGTLLPLFSRRVLMKSVVTIEKDILRAHQQLGLAVDELEALQQTLSQADHDKWALEAKKAQSKRLKNVAKVSAMDIYNSRLDTGSWHILVRHSELKIKI